MKSLKSFFIAYKKAYDNFTLNLSKSFNLLEKECIKQKTGIAVDTLSTSMFNIKSVLDELIKNL